MTSIEADRLTRATTLRQTERMSPSEDTQVELLGRVLIRGYFLLARGTPDCSGMALRAGTDPVIVTDIHLTLRPPDTRLLDRNTGKMDRYVLQIE